MPRYTAAQIYAYAREAGFSPDQATTMTAIALAESGGDGRAHNTRGEDSRGLWQINVAAHPRLGALDLYDPAQNARAAFQVAKGGADVSPWTTTHRGTSARYLRYREDAQAAAAAYGDGGNLGVWTGTAGYGQRLAAGAGPDRGRDVDEGSDAVVLNANQPTAGVPRLAERSTGRAGEEYGIPLDDSAEAFRQASRPGSGPAPDVRRGAEFGVPLEETGDAAGAGAVVDAAGAGGGAEPLRVFLDAALAQAGDTYVYGAETRLDDRDPDTFDCSELVQWAAHQAGVKVNDGAIYQYRQMRNSGTLIPVEEAIRTPGALLFSFSGDPDRGVPGSQHVAISLGDGRTIEARNSRDDVGIFPASGKRFQYAALIPGLSDRRNVAPTGPDEPVTVADPAPQPADPAPHPADPAPQPADSARRPADQAVEPDDDRFDRRLASDPDVLDRAVVEDPVDLDTSATALSVAGDVDADGLDDALAQSMYLDGADPATAPGAGPGAGPGGWDADGHPAP